MLVKSLVGFFVAALACGCDSNPASGADLGDIPDGGSVQPCSGTRPECAAQWQASTATHLDAIVTSPTELTAFLMEVPKGADLHNHLSGAVWAESYLDWAQIDGDCVNSSTFSVVAKSQCSATNVAIPSSGPLFDSIVRAWSMQDFVPGAQSGHDHFFATFGKYGLVAGSHRDDSIADVAARAADENQLYLETMFNLGKNVGTLAGTVWTASTVTAADLPTFYDQLVANPGFAAAVASDAAVVDSADRGWHGKLGCGVAGAPAACNVTVRFVAQVARTGSLDGIFGQLVSAFEMAKRTPNIVAANLSSPEDDTTSLKNYDVHMAMLDFLYNKYSATSPLHVTLHAGELVPKYLPAAYPTANTFHIRAAVDTGHAERIGHGLDVLSETDAPGLLDELHAKNVMVEVCLSSNDQILEVRGAAHPLSQYLAHGVPVALATDDQGVSRSSLAGEYARAVQDQQLRYLQLKAMARTSLEHSFVPGASLWSDLAGAQPVAACAPTATMALGDPPTPACQQLLDASQRAQLQWELERRFLAFESRQ